MHWTGRRDELAIDPISLTPPTAEPCRSGRRATAGSGPDRSGPGSSYGFRAIHRMAWNVRRLSDGQRGDPTEADGQLGHDQTTKPDPGLPARALNACVASARTPPEPPHRGRFLEHYRHNSMTRKTLARQAVSVLGLVQNPPFQGNSLTLPQSRRGRSPCLGQPGARGDRNEPADHAGRAKRRNPSSSSQCPCTAPVSSSAGVRPCRSGRSLRSSTRWFR